MTAAEILALIVSLLPDIEELSTQLQTVVPIAEKIIAGTALTEAELEALASTAATVSQQAAAIGG